MRIQAFMRAILLITLLFGVSVDSAQARPSFSGHSSSASSFKGGFSSRNSAAASPSMVQPNSKSTSFGSFGAPASSAQPSSPVASSNSALSKNLSTTAANSSALKTLDARNQAAAPVSAGGANTVTGGGAQSGYAPSPVYQPGYGQAAVPQTIIVQRDRGFSTSPFLWFMLGRSMSNQGGDRVVYEHQVNTSTGTVGNPDGVDTAPAASSWEPHESLGAKLLRIVLWLMLAIALVMGVSYLLARRAARAVTNKSHYSLGKN
jgi:hypothetical protein